MERYKFLIIFDGSYPKLYLINLQIILIQPQPPATPLPSIISHSDRQGLLLEIEPKNGKYQLVINCYHILFQKQRMEKQMKITAFAASATPTEDQLKISHNIINECDSTVGSYGFVSSQGLRSKNKSKLPSYVFDPLQPNPQDKLVVDKCVQKIKSILTRPQKQSMIRKSELGQNQFVFTNEQIMKLEIIDEFLQKGYELPNDPFNIELFPKINAEQIDIETSNKQSNQPNPFQAEIDNFCNWRLQGNKENVLAITDDVGKRCIQSIDLKKLDQQKSHRKRKELKLLNFVDYYRQMIHTRKLDKIRSSIQGPQQLKATKFDKLEKLHLNPKRSFSGENHLKQSIATNKNQFSETPKNNNTSILNLRAFRKMQQKNEAINQLTNEYSKMKTTNYMTSERKQALYNCKVIKMTKKFMSHKDYVKLRIITGATGSVNEKSSDSPFYDHDAFTNRNEKERLVNRESLHIEKVLEKNRNRLKFQKQRVIEKLRC